MLETDDRSVVVVDWLDGMDVWVKGGRDCADLVEFDGIREG